MEGTEWRETVILTGVLQEEEVEVQYKLVRAMMPQLLEEAVGEVLVGSMGVGASYYLDYVEEAVAVVPMSELLRLKVAVEIVQPEALEASVLMVIIAMGFQVLLVKVEVEAHMGLEEVEDIGEAEEGLQKFLDLEGAEEARDISAVASLDRIATRNLVSVGQQSILRCLGDLAIQHMWEAAVLEMEVMAA